MDIDKTLNIFSFWTLFDLSGESPSSSASDVDNVNNPTAADKVALSKSVNSPQVAGNHVISARSRPNFVRILNYVST
jgi:hypothetical protein